MRDFSARVRRAVNVYVDSLAQIAAEPVVNKRYTYRIVPAMFAAFLSQLHAQVNSIFDENDRGGNWFSRLYVESAMARGTTQAFANLSQQSPAYKAGRGSLQALLASEPFQRRINLVREGVNARMESFGKELTANLSNVLADGIGRGLNPRTIAGNLKEIQGISEARAHRIARTEIPMALRKARWDETEEANDEFGLRTMEMHLSALSPTTRVSHAERHGKLFTMDEVRDWWDEGANAVNCKCSTTSVMVDKDGNPIVGEIVECATQAKRNMESMNYAWAKE
jgi:SPP1 gp7 family putative phage head morphogenesis protein